MSGKIALVADVRMFRLQSDCSSARLQCCARVGLGQDEVARTSEQRVPVQGPHGHEQSTYLPGRTTNNRNGMRP